MCTKVCTKIGTFPNCGTLAYRDRDAISVPIHAIRFIAGGRNAVRSRAGIPLYTISPTRFKLLAGQDFAPDIAPSFTWPPDNRKL
jgi:hypothetical protein